MSNKAYIVIVCTMICVTCLVAAEHDDSGSADDYPVKIPWQVLKKLLDISHRSKGLFQLWKNAFHLTKDVFFKDKVIFTSVCIIIFNPFITTCTFEYILQYTNINFTTATIVCMQLVIFIFTTVYANKLYSM